MKNNEYKATVRIIEPEEGHWLTQKEAPKELYNYIFSKKVYLATNDAPENWKEITDAEKIEIEEKIKEAEEAERQAELNK